MKIGRGGEGDREGQSGEVVSEACEKRVKQRISCQVGSL